MKRVHNGWPSVCVRRECLMWICFEQFCTVCAEQTHTDTHTLCVRSACWLFWCGVDRKTQYYTKDILDTGHLISHRVLLGIFNKHRLSASLPRGIIANTFGAVHYFYHSFAFFPISQPMCVHNFPYIAFESSLIQYMHCLASIISSVLFYIGVECRFLPATVAAILCVQVVVSLNESRVSHKITSEFSADETVNFFLLASFIYSHKNWNWKWTAKKIGKTDE